MLFWSSQKVTGYTVAPDSLGLGEGACCSCVSHTSCPEVGPNHLFRLLDEHAPGKDLETTTQFLSFPQGGS